MYSTPLFFTGPPTEPSICLDSAPPCEGVFENRDICIEMFYSELLMVECSDTELGGAGMLLGGSGGPDSGIESGRGA